MEKPWNGHRTLKIPGSTSKASPSWYEYQGYDAEETLMLPAEGPDTPRATITVLVRAVRVYSTALLRTKMKTLDRMRAREKAAVIRAIRDWQDVVYACASDAKRAADRHVAQSAYTSCTLVAQVAHHDGPAKRGRGRPRVRPEPPLAAGEHWRVTYVTKPLSESQDEARLHDQATFILIRTCNEGWTIDDEEMVRRYKGQQHV